jgi:tRNA modification GTPase
VEAGRTLGGDESAIAGEDRTLLVRTKADLAPSAGDAPLAVSIVTGAGLADLRRAAAERAFADRIALGDLEPALTRERHRTALLRSQAMLAAALPHLAADRDAVLASHHVREATQALDELLGTIDVEEVLGAVFARFCVGK